MIKIKKIEIINRANNKEFSTLEIGSGYKPSPKSDILLDKYMENKERGADLKKSKPLIIASAEDMSFFNDNIFNYVIARHVLEHAINPEKMLNEIERVGKAGYIETPTELLERLSNPRSYHKWYINLIDNTLVIKPIKDSDYFGLGYLIKFLYENNKDFRRLFFGCEKLWKVKYYWKEKINYSILPYSSKLLINYRDIEILEKLVKINKLKRLKAWINPKYYIFINDIFDLVIKFFKEKS